MDVTRGWGAQKSHRHKDRDRDRDKAKDKEKDKEKKEKEKDRDRDRDRDKDKEKDKEKKKKRKKDKDRDRDKDKEKSDGSNHERSSKIRKTASVNGLTDPRLQNGSASGSGTAGPGPGNIAEHGGAPAFQTSAAVFSHRPSSHPVQEAPPLRPPPHHHLRPLPPPPVAVAAPSLPPCPPPPPPPNMPSQPPGVASRGQSNGRLDAKGAAAIGGDFAREPFSRAGLGGSDFAGDSGPGRPQGGVVAAPASAKPDPFRMQRHATAHPRPLPRTSPPLPASVPLPPSSSSHPVPAPSALKSQQPNLPNGRVETKASRKPPFPRMLPEAAEPSSAPLWTAGGAVARSQEPSGTSSSRPPDLPRPLVKTIPVPKIPPTVKQPAVVKMPSPPSAPPNELKSSAAVQAWRFTAGATDVRGPLNGTTNGAAAVNGDSKESSLVGKEDLMSVEGTGGEERKREGKGDWKEGGEEEKREGKRDGKKDKRDGKKDKREGKKESKKERKDRGRDRDRNREREGEAKKGDGGEGDAIPTKVAGEDGGNSAAAMVVEDDWLHPKKVRIPLWKRDVKKKDPPRARMGVGVGEGGGGGGGGGGTHSSSGLVWADPLFLEEVGIFALPYVIPF
ncbi:hypothetical protein CBR_g55209 [Chara braunii]|uniref:Uncharacterized protein n=1 Tax=Chara braunii TaxID=69332 RepID=A0A388MCN7_CHABU|nr:hypothetical protein CBR_g55209 [Chara braunii]|eukprot:GBG92328.1 hypothetical protein CBR_g55209 [Chara braunii]